MLNPPVEIKLYLNSIEELFRKNNVSFFHSLKLNEGAEEFIIENALASPRKTSIILKIHIPLNEISRSEEVKIAIRQHFTFCKQKSEKQLTRTLQLGWRSLLIAIIFLSLMFLLTKVVNRFLPEGGVAMTIEELLIILGWVALWRPADLLLYEWYPHKRNIKLFRRLEQSKVQIVT